ALYLNLKLINYETRSVLQALFLDIKLLPFLSFLLPADCIFTSTPDEWVKCTFDSHSSSRMKEATRQSTVSNPAIHSAIPLSTIQFNSQGTNSSSKPWDPAKVLL
ncbi:hypothetical protein FRC02_005785, partial [Tulasnella sp. 418]